MPVPTLTTLVGHTPAKAVDVMADLNALLAVLTGGIDADNISNHGIPRDKLATDLLEKLGVSDTSTTRRGRSANLGGYAIAGTSYASASTPDKVSGIHVPSGGVLEVNFMVDFLKLGADYPDYGTIGLFVNGQQVKAGDSRPSVATTYIELAVFAGQAPIIEGHVISHPGAPYGMVKREESGAGSFEFDTDIAAGPGGFPLGLWLPIQVDPGTYDVELKYKRSAGGSISVSNRVLLVKTENFS